MMPPEGCQSLPPDVLSDLPDNVIDVILMCLPCKEAVRTSILSKKWRYHWCRLTELTLDVSHWSTEEDFLHPTVKFSKIIYQFLTLHEGPITKFTLDIANLQSCPEIDFFIYFLSRNGIQHLVLHLPEDSRLPCSLFTCFQLRHLNLHDCLIHPPSVFKGFDRLVSLELCEVTGSSESLESLISHCPLLEQLVLEISKVSNIIEINAPKLRSFDFTGSIASICLKNVPILAKASLICDGYSMEAENFDFAKFFESCFALEHLLFDLYSAEDIELFADDAPPRLTFDLNCVKRLYLPGISLENHSYQLSCALCLIRSFPHLEYLEIEVCYDDDDDVAESLFSGVTFNHLREAKLERFHGTTPQKQLIKFLLGNSPVLMRMLIDPSPLLHEPLETRLKLLAELSTFWHASPKAEVVFIKPLIG